MAQEIGIVEWVEIHGGQALFGLGGKPLTFQVGFAGFPGFGSSSSAMVEAILASYVNKIELRVGYTVRYMPDQGEIGVIELVALDRSRK